MARAITIEGLGELTAKLADASALAAKAMAESIREEVETVRDDARSKAPVLSGDLKAGIVGLAGEKDGTIRSTARHSTFVEHGTYKDPSQPFMAPAAEASRARWPARAGAKIRMALEGL